MTESKTGLVNVTFALSVPMKEAGAPVNTVRSGSTMTHDCKDRLQVSDTHRSGGQYLDPPVGNGGRWDGRSVLGAVQDALVIGRPFAELLRVR